MSDTGDSDVKTDTGEAPPKRKPRVLRALLRTVLLIVIPAATVLAGTAYWLTGGRFVATENAYVKADIAHVSAELDARVDRILVRDHADVEAGQLLIELDAAPYRMALLRAEAEIETARQQIAAREAAWREAKSELAQAEGRLAYLNTQVKRQKRLAKRGIVASTRLEEVAEDLRGAKDRVRVMREKVARARVELGGEPGRDPDLHPLVREKIVAREEAKLKLSRTRITAPVSGQIVNLRLQVGEHIESAKPLMAIVSKAAPWVEANFKETELTHIREGMAATIELDIYPGETWAAKVGSISPATGAEFALLPPQNASGNWVKVVQRLPVKFHLKGDGPALPLRAGMTATVSVDTKRKRSLEQVFGPWGAVADTYAARLLKPITLSPATTAEAAGARKPPSDGE